MASYTVRAEWDDDGAVWVAASDDVPGLVTEAETLEGLIAKLHVMVPEMLELNGVLGAADAAVLGGLPVRQWVLTLPHRLRYALAWDHRLCRGVLAVFVRAVLGFERRRARRRGVRDGRGGAVTAIQRFGSALNTNVRG